jgi:hypothetical protein
MYVYIAHAYIHTHTLSLSLCLSLSRMHTHTLSLTHTHLHTHNRTHLIRVQRRASSGPLYRKRSCWHELFRRYYSTGLCVCVDGQGGGEVCACVHIVVGTRYLRTRYFGECVRAHTHIHMLSLFPSQCVALNVRPPDTHTHSHSHRHACAHTRAGKEAREERGERGGGGRGTWSRGQRCQAQIC